MSSFDMSDRDDQSLRGQLSRERLPTGLPFRCYGVLDAPRTRRASPLLAGLSTGVTSSSGNSITRQGISLMVLFGHVLFGHRSERNSTPWMPFPACRHADGTI